MKSGFAKLLLACAILAGVAGTGSIRAQAPEEPGELVVIFERDIEKRLDVPADEAQRYGQLLQSGLGDAGIKLTNDQIVIVVDRNPDVQALLLYWRPASGPPALIGASPVSTGRPGEFEHFLTPLGVFEHTLANPDFRAEGTRNAHGLRGYGARGMRIFDFGWQPAYKTWGDRARSIMRLQIHATDPDHLEKRLGTAQSKGCIRIPASLNRLIDQYGLLDAAYEKAMLEGKVPWVLHPKRTPTPWSGRFLVVVETQRSERPAWSPGPLSATKSPLARREQVHAPCT